MVDIHSHILPYIDDGSSSLEESLLMARMAYESGVDSIIATPHINIKEDLWNVDKIESSVKVLNEELVREGIPVKVYIGAEIYAFSDLPFMIESKGVITLNKTKYVLVEFGFEEDLWWMESQIRLLADNGYYPIIAHPERYKVIHNNVEAIKGLKDLGAYVQVNKGSLLGRFGKKAQNVSNILLNEGLVTCVASDAHGCNIRTNDFSGILDFLKRKYFKSYINSILYENPLKILNGEKI